MILYLFVGLIALSSAVAVLDWRRGCFMLVAIGVLQDVVRKSLPGAPPQLVLATVPVWCCIISNLMLAESQPWSRLRRAHRGITTAMICLVVAMIPAAVKSATFGDGSWKITLVGLFSYASVILGMLVGFHFARRTRDIVLLMTVYCVLTAIMLIGSPLDYLGWSSRYAIIGTQVMNMDWVRFSGAGYIKLYAGFYRSPDIMGWHAAMLVMLACTLALMSRRGLRMLWAGVAAWGLLAVMLCGRRKMVLMLPIFLLVFVASYLRRERKGELARFALPVVAAVVGIATIAYQLVGPSEQTVDYYFSTKEEVARGVLGHGLLSLFETVRQSGWFGVGLGTASTGIQHLDAARPRTWQEGGLGRVLVEIGVPGLACFLIMAIALVRRSADIATQEMGSRREKILFAGLIGIFLANGASFVVSQQVYGDPFVMCMFVFWIGVLLSSARMMPRMAVERSARASAGRNIGAKAPVRRPTPGVAGQPHG